MKVSIVIPTYNRASVIHLTLNSILSQTHTDWECIIVDDHSTDDTKKIILEYCVLDKRFKYTVNQRNKGAQGARNTGILQATSFWICIFDSDDIMYPNFLEVLINSINKKTDVISCWCNKVSQLDGSSVVLKWGGKGNITRELLIGKTYVGYDSALIRKQCLINIGLLDEEIKAYQEYDTHIRLSQICNYSVVEEPLFDYIVGATDTISVQNHIVRLEKQFLIIYKHCKLWRQKAYWNLLKKMTVLYVSLGKEYRKTIIKLTPEIAAILPVYFIYKKFQELIAYRR